MAKAHLQHETVDGKDYWFAAGQAACGELETPLVHLLPNYDEYVIAYKDHTATLDPALSGRADAEHVPHGTWRTMSHIEKSCCCPRRHLPGYVGVASAFQGGGAHASPSKRRLTSRSR
ncbi:hypothetical protein WMF38_51730 [Sorangium sp. So ce118]